MHEFLLAGVVLWESLYYGAFIGHTSVSSGLDQITLRRVKEVKGLKFMELRENDGSQSYMGGVEW